MLTAEPTITEFLATLRRVIVLIASFESLRRRIAEQDTEHIFEGGKRGAVLLGNRKIQYWFHGSGCSLVYEPDVALEYDYVGSVRDASLHFSPWKLMTSLNSVLGHAVYDQELVATMMEDLRNAGVYHTTERFPFHYGITTEFVATTLVEDVFQRFVPH